MITGDDFVMVVAVDPMVLVRDFLQEWSSRWPNMCVAPGENPDAGFESWPQAASRVSVGEGDVLVARDRQMESEWSEKG
jgi:hypothetical protein